jgi:peptidoglycan/xylan/chitin deacetylase (PgdA/CDA1 family)
VLPYPLGFGRIERFGRIVPPLHRLAGLAILAALIIGLLAPGTTRTPAGGTHQVTGTATPTGPVVARPARAVRAHAPPARIPIGAAAPAARQARANELGVVPVLMYHRILPKGQVSLDRTTKELRGELERLAKGGYVPITAAELVSGRIDIPAGRHPVVLTFDDGHPSHFALDANGVPRPGTVVAMLLDVARRYPGFRPVATFFVNREPFLLGGQSIAGVRWLLQHGFEIGNHTLGHPDLSRMSRRQVQREIGGDERQIVQLTGGHAVTLAYPFGAIPKKAAWATRLAGEYDFRGAFLAGWRPSSSPFAKDFDPMEIPRIRSEGKIKEEDCARFCSSAWLDWLDKHPDNRYTSDGDRSVISFPRAEEARLGDGFRVQGRSY